MKISLAHAIVRDNLEVARAEYEAAKELLNKARVQVQVTNATYFALKDTLDQIELATTKSGKKEDK